MSDLSAKASSAEPMLEYEPGFDRAALVESVYKWLWLTGMVFVLACFLPAAEGRFVNRSRPSTVQGWQLAQIAHLAAWYAPQAPQDVERRTYPVSATTVILLAWAAVIATWAVLVAGALSLYGTTRPLPHAYLRWACRVALLGVICGIVSTLLWFSGRGLTAHIGAYLWIASPLLLAFGLARAARLHPPLLVG